MKLTVFALASGIMLATTANAGGIAFSLPNLEFPTTDTVTAGKDCERVDATSPLCTADR